METSTRPSEQQYFDGMRPADEPDVEAVKQAIYLWLDGKVSQRRAGEEVKQLHAQMLAALTEAGIEWHPYLDPFTQKKRRVWIAKEPKAKTSGVPRPASEGRRGSDRRAIDVDLEPKADDKVESRRVPRKSVEKEIDPFAATRGKMSGGVLEHAEAKQDGKPIPEVEVLRSRATNRKKAAKRPKGKRDK